MSASLSRARPRSSRPRRAGAAGVRGRALPARERRRGRVGNRRRGPGRHGATSDARPASQATRPAVPPRLPSSLAALPARRARARTRGQTSSRAPPHLLVRVRDLPRQLSVDELAELFEGRTRLVERLAETEDPLGRPEVVIAELTEAEKIEALGAHPAIGARRLSARSAREQGEEAEPEVAAELASAEPCLRGEVRFSVRGLREPPASRGAGAYPPRAPRAHAGGGARHGARRARRNRPRPLEAGMSIHYGKAEIGVYRTDGVSSLFAAEVTLDVFGENFMPAYTEGDNSLVVATDTMKNFVHANALEYDGESLEGLLRAPRRALPRHLRPHRADPARGARDPVRPAKRRPLPAALRRRRRRRARARPGRRSRSTLRAGRRLPDQDHRELVHPVRARRLHDPAGDGRSTAVRPPRRPLAYRTKPTGAERRRPRLARGDVRRLQLEVDSAPRP